MIKTDQGVLYLCATPIGNLEDITLRALRILREVDLVAAEDTRHTRKLLTHYGIGVNLTSYHEHNKKIKGEILLNKLKGGVKIALVTDAGLPGVSDPGEELVGMALENMVPVVAVPGPTAGVTALVVSGLSTKYFVFEGFLPVKKKEREKRLRLLQNETRTLVLYESPHRLIKTLDDLTDALGDKRRMAVARELTKLHEEITRGAIKDVAAYFRDNAPRGEFTLVVEGAADKAGGALPGDETAVEYVSYLVGLGVDKKIAIREAALKHGVPKKEVYNAVIRENELKA